MYWDLQGHLDYDGVRFIVGVRNLLDQAPPFFPEGNANASAETCDVVGRWLYVRVGHTFK